MATPITIRRAGEADAEQLFALVTQFMTTYEPSREAFNRALPLVLARTDGDLLVAEGPTDPVGYVLAVDQPTFFANGPVAEVLELFVAEGSRGQGIGRHLVEDVAIAARQRGCIEVTVPTRRAGPFYEKIGFERTAEFFKRRL